MTVTKSHILFLVGGAASGKSELGLRLASQGEGANEPKAFVATAQPRDQEMAEKIRRHREARDRNWVTEEIPIQLREWFRDQASSFPIVVVDCLTLWLSNIQETGCQDDQILDMTHDLVGTIRESSARVILISNELGLGLVPMERESRNFRNLAGQVNQLVAAEADEVLFCLMGQPLKVK